MAFFQAADKIKREMSERVPPALPEWQQQVWTRGLDSSLQGRREIK
jgi:hypothetical protein